LTVDIPILQLLYDELSGCKKVGEYVFPEQAAMYKENPDGITWRVKKVLSAALTEDDQDEGLPELPLEDTRKKGHAYLDQLGATSKAGKMRAAFDLYLDGVPGPKLQEQVGVSKGTVSGYLNEIEAHIGCKVIKGRTKRSTTDKIKADALLLSETREDGKRRASIRDFHSFRVTWVTLALTSGMPLEMVKKVTGHRTTEIVLKHYFKPGREDLRRVLLEKMPRVVTHGLNQLPEPVSTASIQDPSELLNHALANLAGIQAPDHIPQLKTAVDCIIKAQKWFDDHQVQAEKQ
jgi:hypothetical protein